MRFPYDPIKAKSLLTSNSWKVAPGGVTTCVKPGTAAGDCGAGITADSSLRGVLPLNPTLVINPENWYFVK